MSKIRVFKGYWTENDVLLYSNCLFVFGDNDVGRGKGDQAIIRGLKNTINIPTKKYPSYDNTAYYNDDELDLNKIKIDKAIIKLIEQSKNYEYVVFSEYGLGTGLSQLPQKAPNTYAYLVDKIINLKTLI